MISDIAAIRRWLRSRRAVGTVAALSAAVLLSACQATGFGQRAPSPSPSPAARPAGHVFVIVLENRSYDEAMQEPYIAKLARTYAVATNYSAVAIPSLPNYLAMTSGSTWGVEDNEYHRLPRTGLGTQLTQADITWKAYMEGFTGDCFESPYPYALKHNPFAYYGGDCPANVVPLTELAADLRGTTPQLSWITPGLCNDGHDCGLPVVGSWLASMVPQITASPAWKKDGVLFIAWDEPGSGESRIPLIVVTPAARGQRIATALDHFSLLATISDRLGVPRLGQAKQASSLQGQLQAWARKTK
jgi:phosphatidylinositol-3-phosphatase